MSFADAKKRGVDVKAILDKSHWTEKYSGATYLSSHQIPVLIDDKHAIAHNKVMIIDDNTLITGSFNRKGNQKECGGKRVWLVGVVGFA